MATQEQLATLQKILNLAQEVGLNKSLNGDDEKMAQSNNINMIGDTDAFNNRLSAICKSNTNTTFIIYVSIDTPSTQNNNNKYSKLITQQLSNNILSSIQAVATEQFADYRLSLYRMTDVKSAVIISLKGTSKAENIKTIQELVTAIKAMITGACGQSQSVSICTIARKDNEDEASILQRSDLLFKKYETSNNSVIYDAEYFAVSAYDSANNEKGTNDVTSFIVNSNEIITVCIGETGTNMGREFFSAIMGEHKLNKSSGKFMGNLNRNQDTLLLDKINTYFTYRPKQDIFSPRALFVDVDSERMNKFKSGYLGSLLPDNQFFGDDMKESNHYSQGYYAAQQVAESIVERVRAVAETCGNPQGFQFMHSMKNGIGAGLTSLVEQKLRDAFSDKMCANFSVIADGDKKETSSDQEILENYNFVLSLQKIQQNANMLFPIDHSALRRIFKLRLKMQREPTVQDYAWLSSLVIAGVTSPFRFYGEPGILSNMQKMYMSFSILGSDAVHLQMAHSPFLANFNQDDYKMDQNAELSAAQVKSELLSKVNNISYSTPRRSGMFEDGKLLQFATLYKSNNEAFANKFDRIIRPLCQSMADDAVTWEPMNFLQSAILHQCEYYDEYVPLVATSIAHSTAIKNVYRALGGLFQKNLQEKAMLSSYHDQGMDAEEFKVAETNINALITRYQDQQDAVIDLDADDEEDDDDDDDEDEDEDEDESSDD